MRMRITNKVMQNNALSNINNNKVLQDTLNTQLSTGKKIYKPSEDPVTAIRALRLRSDVSQVTQFYKKNVPDANSWLELTESSVKTVMEVVKNMVTQCEKGSNDTLTTGDRQIIINSLKQLKDEVYSTGNSDYAGRYIFTGYRTETPLTFKENSDRAFKIKEFFDKDSITQETYIGTNNGVISLGDITETSFDDTVTPNHQMKEQQITSSTYYRIRLAYDNLSGLEIPIKDSNGNEIDLTSYADKEAAYEAISSEPAEKMFFLKSTGELLLSDSLYNKIKSGDISLEVSYEKNNWNRGDLMPQHYFYCEETTKEGKVIKYNDEDEDKDGVPDIYKNGLLDQSIEYQVGFDQSARVNTTAGEIFKHGVTRDVKEIIDLANQLDDAEAIQSKLASMLKDSKYSDTQKESIQQDKDAADKAVSLLKDQMQKKFSKSITYMQSYLDSANEALTMVGNRSSRVKLVENRLSSQTTTFKTLQSENEDADATEVAVQLSSAQVSYQAALMATSDMIKETLLNYL
ncbi:MAG TPA: flagellar hook-associated protein 3 [Lachnospiraceae bacterium]|nr:flagellar hook-associated protein 3 [Lachnospiraceae bacterium]